MHASSWSSSYLRQLRTYVVVLVGLRRWTLHLSRSSGAACAFLCVTYPTARKLCLLTTVWLAQWLCYCCSIAWCWPGCPWRILVGRNVLPHQEGRKAACVKLRMDSLISPYFQNWRKGKVVASLYMQIYLEMQRMFYMTRFWVDQIMGSGSMHGHIKKGVVQAWTKMEFNNVFKISIQFNW